jgi:CheY-like chemotaxis protein
LAHSLKPVVLCIGGDQREADGRASVLRQAAYDVLLAFSGEAGLGTFSSTAVDAVLLDYELPGMNGAAVAAEMKRRNPSLPILMFASSLGSPPGAENVIDALAQNTDPPDAWLRQLAGMVSRRHGYTVLNVDDNYAQRYAVTRMLEVSGFTVEEAANGEQTLRAALRNPDLIVLDVNLPDIHGFDVCRTIKRDPRTAAIPVLHLSATCVAAADRAQGLKAGADGFLTHPIERDELVQAIETLIAPRRPRPGHR